MVLEVGRIYPGTVQILPPAWDLTVTLHYRQAIDAETLVKFRPEAGTFHYAGGGASKEPFYNDQFVDGHKGGFGLPAIFYRDLPWMWVKFMGKCVGAPAHTGIHSNSSACQQRRERTTHAH